MSPAEGTETATADLVGRDGRWQQPDTPCSLISAPQWPHTHCTVVDRRGLAGSEKDRL